MFWFQDRRCLDGNRSDLAATHRSNMQLCRIPPTEYDFRSEVDDATAFGSSTCEELCVYAERSSYGSSRINCNHETGRDRSWNPSQASAKACEHQAHPPLTAVTFSHAARASCTIEACNQVHMARRSKVGAWRWSQGHHRQLRLNPPTT